jgi:DNA-binding transcriptional regulator YhcF (GntR family)
MSTPEHKRTRLFVRMTDSAARRLFIRIDPHSPRPLQNQIYEGIRRAILSRVVAAGTKLPSSRALAADLGISRITTVLALEQLAAEGYVTARPGAGTFVSRELPGDGAGTLTASKRAYWRHPTTLPTWRCAGCDATRDHQD